MLYIQDLSYCFIDQFRKSYIVRDEKDIASIWRHKLSIDIYLFMDSLFCIQKLLVAFSGLGMFAIRAPVETRHCTGEVGIVYLVVCVCFR